MLTEEKVTRKTRTHFCNLLNQPEPEGQAGIPEAEQDLDKHTGKISIREVKEVIKALRAGKLPGEDNVDPDMLKAGRETTKMALHKILNEIWQSVKATVE